MPTDPLRERIARLLGWEFDSRVNRWLDGRGSVRLAPPNPERSWADAGALVEDLIIKGCEFDIEATGNGLWKGSVWWMGPHDYDPQPHATVLDPNRTYAFLGAACLAWEAMKEGQCD